MNSKKIICLAVLIGLFCVAPLVMGQSGGIENPLGVNDFPSLLSKISTQLGTLLASLGAIAVLVAGFLYMTSAGDPGRVKTAKTALIYAIIGIIVGATAATIAGSIKTTVTGTDVNAIITSIATLFGQIMASAGVIMVIFSGILYLTSAGDPAKIKTAKTALIYAIAGIAIGIAAVTIVSIITGAFSGTT